MNKESLFSCGYTVDKTGLRVWPFSKYTVKWSEVGYSWTYINRALHYVTIIKYDRDGKTKTITLNYEPLSYRIDKRIQIAVWACEGIKDINKVCFRTQEMSKYPELDDSEEGKAYKFWLKLQYNEAEELCLKKLRENENNYLANRILGFVYVDSGNPENAIIHLKKALECQPKDLNIIRWLIFCNYSLDRIAERDEFVDKYYALMPFRDYDIDIMLATYAAETQHDFNTARGLMEQLKAYVFCRSSIECIDKKINEINILQGTNK